MKITWGVKVDYNIIAKKKNLVLKIPQAKILKNKQTNKNTG